MSRSFGHPSSAAVPSQLSAAVFPLSAEEASASREPLPETAPPTVEFVVSKSVLICQLAAFFMLEADDIRAATRREETSALRPVFAKLAVSVREFLASGVSSMFSLPQLADCAEVLRRAEEFIMKLEQNWDYRSLLKKLEDGRLELQASWASESGKSHRLIREVTGLSFEGERATFCVVLPECPMPRFFRRGVYPFAIQRASDTPSIAGPASAVVGIWHTLLHGRLGASEISHAIICLVADNELRFFLEGSRFDPKTSDEVFAPTDLRPLVLAMAKRFHEFQKIGAPDILEFERQMVNRFGWKRKFT